MKKHTSVFILLTLVLSNYCTAQQIGKAFLKVDDYTKGELEIRITSFGEEHPITIGKITADGIIQLDWPELNYDELKDNRIHSTSIKYVLGSRCSKDPNTIISNAEVILVESKDLDLFKYGQRVGCIIPSTQKGQEHNNQQLGGTVYWIYSNDATSAKASCSVKKEWADVYSFDETTSYDLNFKKGWNLVSNRVSAMEETEKGKFPKTRIIQTIEHIPNKIEWKVKYWANDEILELEQRLIAKVPITKQRYENWIPKKLAVLNRVSYEVYGEIENIPIANNVNLFFEKGSKKLNLIIVDCVGTKEATRGYTLQQDMASRDWKDESETGYKSASSKDGLRVITEYDESKSNALLMYNMNERFFVIAEATNIKPKELWKYLKSLDLASLTN